MNENLTPFLLCIKKEKLAGIIQQLDDHQVKRHGVHYKLPDYLTSRDPDIINAPSAQEEAELETLKEISRPPSHQERVN